MRFNVHKSTISRLVRKHPRTGDVKDLPKPGRSRVTTRQEDNLIATRTARNRRTTATELRRNLREVRGAGANDVSLSTIRRRLHAAGMKSRVAAVKPTLQPRHRAARRAWGRDKRNWRRHQWQACLFTDESRFCLAPGSRRIRVWRRRGERRHNPLMVNAKELFGGGGIMV